MSQTTQFIGCGDGHMAWASAVIIPKEDFRRWLQLMEADVWNGSTQDSDHTNSRKAYSEMVAILGRIPP